MIRPFANVAPQLGDDAFVAENATVLGAVRLGARSSVWYGSVLRGDVGSISVGERTNIQDLSVVHVTTDRYDTVVGNEVTVGHRVILHGCVIEDRVLVGMGAIIMDGAQVGAEAMVGAGALLTPGTEIPAGTLALGAPARVVRSLGPEERRHIRESAAHYVDLAAMHRATPPAAR